MQPEFCSEGVKQETSRRKGVSAGLVPGRKLREVLGQQSVDTADGAGAGMLLEPRPDALRGQGQGWGQLNGEQESSWGLEMTGTHGEALQ